MAGFGQGHPDPMAGYMTYELAEALGQLTAQQRKAIARIVDHHFIQNKPMAELFRGDDRICAEARYYRRGRVDAETGKASEVGWSHQKGFTDALAMASRLALQTRVNEETHAVKEAVRRARLAAAPIVAGLVRIAANADADKDKIAASKEVLGIALKGTQFGERESTDGLESDWWRAVEESE